MVAQGGAVGSGPAGQEVGRHKPAGWAGDGESLLVSAALTEKGDAGPARTVDGWPRHQRR